MTASLRLCVKLAHHGSDSPSTSSYHHPMPWCDGVTESFKVSVGSRFSAPRNTAYASWSDAYWNAAVTCLRGRRPFPWRWCTLKLIRGFGVRTKEPGVTLADVSHWVYLREMTERFKKRPPHMKFQGRLDAVDPVVLLWQGRPPDAIFSLDSRVKADRLIRKHMWASASEYLLRVYKQEDSKGSWHKIHKKSALTGISMDSVPSAVKSASIH
jgi:hypothetical protein